MRSAVLVLAIAGAILAGATSAATPRPATIATFAGNWIGHTRYLRIDHQGHAVESVDDGCCDHVLSLDFKLSKPLGTTANAKATATVTLIHMSDPGDLGPSYVPPRVGQSRLVYLHNGVLTDELSGQAYCDSAAERRGVCGA
jgi:hypothetical protein